MTAAVPFNERLTNAALKRKWLNKFLNLSARQDTLVKTILLQGAEDARNRLVELQFKQTFSAGVRAAQIRLAMNEIRIVTKEIFGEMIPIIKDGHKDAAAIASGGLSEIDMDYLEQVFVTKSAVADFIESQRRSAQLGSSTCNITSYQFREATLGESLSKQIPCQSVGAKIGHQFNPSRRLSQGYR